MAYSSISLRGSRSGRGNAALHRRRRDSNSMLTTTNHFTIPRTANPTA